MGVHGALRRAHRRGDFFVKRVLNDGSEAGHSVVACVAIVAAPLAFTTVLAAFCGDERDSILRRGAARHGSLRIGAAHSGRHPRVVRDGFACARPGMGRAATAGIGLVLGVALWRSCSTPPAC